MNASFDRCSLYLSPEQHDFSAEDITSLLAALQEIDFIADRIDTKKTDDHYFTGKKFLDYIAYMGCAPAIQFEADEHKDKFCFIKIHQLEKPMLIHSQVQAKAPHCPGCNKPVKNWQQSKTETQIFCERCNTSFNIAEFNWRKMAGVARLFIEITDVFPKEVIPQQLLLDKLANITDVKWLYFYSCR